MSKWVILWLGLVEQKSNLVRAKRSREITVANRVANDKEYLLEIEDVEGSADGSSAVTLLGDKKAI